jgi:UPF0755 protein
LVRKFGCFGVLLILALVAAAFWAAQLWGGAGPGTRNMTLTVAQGSTLTTAARELEKQGAIRDAELFLWMARVFGDDTPIQAGEYRVPAKISQSDLLKMLQGGRTLQRFVMIPEGMPSILVHERLMAAEQLQGEVAVPLEGSILPDSYAYNRGDTRQQVLDRMQSAMDRYLAEAWERRKPNIAVSTPQEALILASIVEKETGKPEERRMVAGVYSNRLRVGMPLQADPTIIYPVTKGKPLGRRILRSERDAKNDYNTYTMRGLPIGPIANPGRASIDAVLNPETTNALYFVADGTGGHIFADTLEQHNANVQKWYALRRARGEM